MASVTLRLPDAQLNAAEAAYRQAVSAKRLRTLIGLLIFAATVFIAGISGEVSFTKFAANIHRFPDYLSNLVPVLSWKSLGADMAEWMWNFRHWFRLLIDTLLIAYLGTLAGALGAFLMCFSATGNLAQSRWSRIATRRALEFCRTVPEIVFALLFVVAFGLGPLPGVLALAIHTGGALGKLFAEVTENVDMKPVEGARATGANWAEVVRDAVLPQVLGNFASYTLLRFEINVRSAAVMGFVGAGGIGQDLMEAIRKFYYSDVSAILLLIIATVVVIDLLTERLRHALIGMERRA